MIQAEYKREHGYRQLFIQKYSTIQIYDEDIDKLLKLLQQVGEIDDICITKKDDKITKGF